MIDQSELLDPDLISQNACFFPTSSRLKNNLQLRFNKQLEPNLYNQPNLKIGDFSKIKCLFDKYPLKTTIPRL